MAQVLLEALDPSAAPRGPVRALLHDLMGELSAAESAHEQAKRERTVAEEGHARLHHGYGKVALLRATASRAASEHREALHHERRRLLGTMISSVSPPVADYPSHAEVIL